MITLADSASDKVSELIKTENEEGLSLRVAVRPGGCSGFSYEMHFDADVASPIAELPTSMPRTPSQ